MKNIKYTLSPLLFANAVDPLPNLNEQQDKMLSYYEKAGPDYEEWSKNFNMHFGFYELGINPFDREGMLNNMNRQVFNRLQLTEEGSGNVVDMGCGLGASLRYAHQCYPDYQYNGVTIVPWQVRMARKLNHDNGLKEINIINADYTKTPFADNSMDAILAIESSCYAKGAAKTDLLDEVYRILKPGGRFVIADGFRKNNAKLKGVMKSAYQKLCSSWALSELGNIDQFESYLNRLGFQSVKVENISWRVAPSVAHVPYTVVKFLLKQLFCAKDKMIQERWDNLKSPLLTMLIGLNQRNFGYFFVSGVKPN